MNPSDTCFADFSDENNISDDAGAKLVLGNLVYQTHKWKAYPICERGKPVIVF